MAPTCDGVPVAEAMRGPTTVEPEKFVSLPNARSATVTTATAATPAAGQYPWRVSVASGDPAATDSATLLLSPLSPRRGGGRPTARDRHLTAPARLFAGCVRSTRRGLQRAPFEW